MVRLSRQTCGVNHGVVHYFLTSFQENFSLLNDRVEGLVNREKLLYLCPVCNSCIIVYNS